MTPENFKRAKQIDEIRRHIRFSLDHLRVKVGESAPYTGQGGPTLTPMDYVMAGFFDEEIYRLRAEAYLAKLDKEMEEL